MLTGITTSYVAQRIGLVRNRRVILDSELAKYFGITTKRLNQHIKRKINKFPEDFRFQLTELEYQSLLTFLGLPIADHGGRRHLPYAITEHGAIMVASVLTDEHAIEVSKMIIHAFIEIKQYAAFQHHIEPRLTALENQMKILTDLMIQSQSKPLALPPPEIPHQRFHYKHTHPTFSGPTKALDQIVHTVATYYRLKPQDLQLRRRTNNVVIPRQIAMYFIRKRIGLGFVEIGNYFGKKDHTTVIHAIKKIEVQLKVNSKISEAIRDIEALFQH